jgi:hypothetical protein
MTTTMPFLPWCSPLVRHGFATGPRHGFKHAGIPLTLESHGPLS